MGKEIMYIHWSITQTKRKMREWVELKIIILSKIREVQKAKCHMSSLLSGV
jgi:hypothetical protein